MSTLQPRISSRPLPVSLLLLTGTVIFLSAFLLFLLEPFLAKRILPWFGGSAAVWSVCLVFYQTALLLGYLYAHLVTRYLTPLYQALLHLGLLCVSLLFLPIGPSQRWVSNDIEHPAWLILVILTGTVALPFITLSATSPLLQHWLARSGSHAPYRLFAVSNAASLLALFAYPLLVEPTLGVASQSMAWSFVYFGFAVLCAVVCWRSTSSLSETAESTATERTFVLPTRKLLWFSLSAVSSLLLLAVTNHLLENVAAVPLLWVLPLAVYLFTFILAFGARGGFKRTLELRLLAVFIGIMAYALYDINAVLAVQVSLPVYLAGLFACCLFCHSELNRLRPDGDQLAVFYLIIAAGGATGAVFVGLIAPNILSGIYELPIGLALLAILTTVLTWNERNWSVRVLWAGVTACAFLVVGTHIQAYHHNAISLRRSFYGSLRVVQSPHAGVEQTRTLFHGTIRHGSQYFLPPQRYRATTYYGPESGIGIVLRECFPSPKRVAIVGLGAGTIAAYGKEGDLFRFYEINEQVADIARTLFYYLRESKAKTEIVLGDARLSLTKETTEKPFDVLALDAFSGDAIPVHLLTREAMLVYKQRLSTPGVLAVHVSNLFLDLAPAVQQLAQSVGWQAILVRNHDDPERGILAADWMLLTNNPAILDNDSIKVHSLPLPAHSSLRLWTDDYNNLVQILKSPQLRQTTIKR